MQDKQYTKQEKLETIDRFAQQFPRVRVTMDLLDGMRSVYSDMEKHNLFVSDESTALFQSFCDTVMQGAAEFLEDQAKAHSQTKMNWTMRNFKRPDDYPPLDVYHDKIPDALIDFMSAKGKKNKRKAGEQLTQCFPDCFNALEITSKSLSFLRFVHPDLLTPAEYNRVVATLNLAQNRAAEFMQTELNKYQPEPKTNWAMQKPIIQSINVLPDEEIELLHEYTSAHLRGDVEAMEKALAELEAPRKEKARLKRPELIQTEITNPLAFGEQVTDNI